MPSAERGLLSSAVNGNMVYYKKPHVPSTAFEIYLINEYTVSPLQISTYKLVQLHISTATQEKRGKEKTPPMLHAPLRKDRKEHKRLP